ncbi:MAG TPA: SDR family oxidoreductase [Croceicoccus sp.]|nr:SDR family oxidoreductase [Croceicoccus sp.]
MRRGTPSARRKEGCPIRCRPACPQARCRSCQAASLEEAGAGLVKACRRSSMLGRMARVEEVAAMAVYLASPLASATTGAVLRVDGGVVEDVH